MNEFPSYLRQLRIARGMTQLDLADALGLPPGMISAWESGRALPTPAQLNAAMRVLSGDVQRALNLIEGVSPSDVVLPPTAVIVAGQLEVVGAGNAFADEPAPGWPNQGIAFGMHD